MHIKDGHKKLRKSKEKEKTMRRTRSMLAVLGIVCALSGITGCSNRNGNTSATNGSESNSERKQWYTDGKQYAKRKQRYTGGKQYAERKQRYTGRKQHTEK